MHRRCIHATILTDVMKIYENWEEFTAGENGPLTKRVYVTLANNGGRRLNRQAYEAFGSPEAVTLHFETRGQKIGLRPCPPSAPNAFRLTILKGHSRIVRLIPFLRNYGIK